MRAAAGVVTTRVKLRAIVGRWYRALDRCTLKHMIEPDRGGAKWDRAARYLQDRDAAQRPPRRDDRAGAGRPDRRLQAHDLPRPRRDGLDAGLPIWSDEGKFGLEGGAFLPPLALTLHEATTLFLAARVLAKARDEHDTELIGAFVKLAQILPPVLAAAHRGDRRRVRHDAAERAVHARLPRAGRGVGAAARGRDRATTPASTTRSKARGGRACSRWRSSHRR